MSENTRPLVSFYVELCHNSHTEEGECVRSPECPSSRCMESDQRCESCWDTARSKAQVWRCSLATAYSLMLKTCPHPDRQFDNGQRITPEAPHQNGSSAPTSDDT